VSARRLLLLGGTGRLGSALLRAAPASWTVLAPGREQLDLRTAAIRDWRNWIKATAPDVVLNAAAMAWVDACEQDPDSARRVNDEAPGWLARACSLEAVPLLHISTDYVFGDPSEGGPPYAEHSVPSPLQSYGRSKAEGEAEVLAAGGRASVVRLSWLTEPGEDTFVRYLLSQVRAGAEQIAVLAQQRSRPTMTPGLSRWLFSLAGTVLTDASVPRILHPAGCEPVTRGEWAAWLLAQRGYGHLPVIDDLEQHPCPAYAVRGSSQQALRPLDSSLDVRATMDWSRQVGLPVLEDWQRMAPAASP